MILSAATASIESPNDAPLSAATVAEAFQRVVARYPDKPAIRTIEEDIVLTWSEVAERVRSLAAGLAGLGVGAADTVWR
jgi:long-chain acyl-CoA synthetase